jgi:succinate dehydrogenase hydrophobic anchor subunit
MESTELFVTVSAAVLVPLSVFFIRPTLTTPAIVPVTLELARLTDIRSPGVESLAKIVLSAGVEAETLCQSVAAPFAA